MHISQQVAFDGEAVRLFPMCAAYELGKRGGSFPSFVKAKAIEALMGLERPTLIRPTDPGAADFYIARAKQDPMRARHWLHEAIETWPECEELIMKNPELLPPSEGPSQNSLPSA